MENRGWYRLSIFNINHQIIHCGYLLSSNDEVIITDTQNARFYEQQNIINGKYNQSQVNYKALCSNGDISLMRLRQSFWKRSNELEFP